jgi:hypothetical protein
MTGQTITSGGVHVAGNFASNGSSTITSDWSPNAQNSQLRPIGNSIYELTVLFPASSAGANLEFKFLRGDNWFDGTQLSEQNVPGNCNSGGNRVIALPVKFMSFNAAYDQCPTSLQRFLCSGTDCDDNDTAKNATFDFYADSDGDSFGAGALVPVCAVNATTPPTGYSLNSTDCNDSNVSIYQFATFFVDADADGYNNGSASVCSGVNTPVGYTTVTSGTDCDDNNIAIYRSAILYTDADGDTYTLGTGSTVCYGASLPTGTSLTQSATEDCNDTDANLTDSCSTGIVVNLSLFIEGYYLGGGLMNSVRNNQDGVSPLDEVEVMTVALHDATAPYALVESVTGMLKTDGTLTCTFTTAPAGSYYIAVKGVNILQTWSAVPQAVGASPLNYDFSSAATQAYGSNMREMAPGVFAFYNGDGNQDEVIDNVDTDPIFIDIDASNFGVLATDLNGDGVVDNSDLDNVFLSIDASRFSDHP